MWRKQRADGVPSRSRLHLGRRQNAASKDASISKDVSISIFMRPPGPTTWSIERVFRDVAANLPAGRRATTFVCPYPSRGVVNRLRTLLWAFRARSEVNHISGDIHYVALALPRRRTILTIHDCGHLSHFSGMKYFLLKLLWFQIPVWRAAIITTVSNRTKDDLLNIVHCNPDNIRVVNNPVSESFRSQPLTFNTDRPRVLQVGTRWNKNTDRVIEAVRELRCTLVLVGTLSTAQHQRLRELRIEYDALHDLSEAELAEQYKRSDLVVLASLFEGFGLPAIEAQAVGRPVVASTRRPLDEVTGGYASFVDPTDADSIREGIERIIDDEDYRNSLVKGGFENVKLFTAQRIAGQYAQLYRELSNRC